MPFTGPPPDKVRAFIEDMRTQLELLELDPSTAKNPQLVGEIELLRFGLERLEKLLPTPEG